MYLCTLYDLRVICLQLRSGKVCMMVFVVSLLLSRGCRVVPVLRWQNSGGQDRVTRPVVAVRCKEGG